MPSPSRSTLTDWARNLADKADFATTHRQNEAELRLELDPTIRLAAGSLHGANALFATAERRSSRRGLQRFDNLYGGVVVEWEWAMGVARREHGAQQALDYLAQLRELTGNDTVFTAVVSDGQQWGFLAVDPAEELTLFDPAPISAADHFHWVPNGEGACRLFLELLGSNQKQPITATALRSVFGPNGPSTRTLVTLLTEGLAGRSPDERPDVLYREWRRALDVVYGNLDSTSSDLAKIVGTAYGVPNDRPVGEYLFVLHTYFALIARLFAVELLAIATEDRQHQPSSWSALTPDELLGRLRGLDHGDLPGGLRIDNLFESDVFGWWLVLCEGSADLLEALRATLSRLAEFAFPRAIHGPERATDVLSDLYQSLVPRQLRKRLGEFLTPRWLAEACLMRLRDQGARLAAGRVIDPTCGTGTFLIPVLAERLTQLRRNRQPEEIDAAEVQAVLDSVAGIDINPTAVAAARVNYVLTLGALARVGALTLPIWRADSLLVPDAPPRQGTLADGPLAGREFRELRTSLAKPFRVPPLLSRADRMAAMRHLLDVALQEANEDTGRASLCRDLDALYGPQRPRSRDGTPRHLGERAIRRRGAL